MDWILDQYQRSSRNQLYDINRYQWKVILFVNMSLHNFLPEKIAPLISEIKHKMISTLFGDEISGLYN